MNNKKTVLFLSANDFKEKSIQVIKKTPEYYAKSGWKVMYIVSRDISKYGNYYYEPVINIPEIDIDRFSVPFCRIKDFIKNNILRTIISKFLGLLVIFKLSFKGLKYINNNDVQILYAYEIHGVLASKIIKLLLFKRKIKYVHRFMGTWIYKYFKERNYFKIFLNLDVLFALKSSSDLCIMTDDGTQGNLALQKIKSKSISNMKFWTNGVDPQYINDEKIKLIKKQFNITNEKIIISVSRLTGWKRVDRVINILNLVKNENIKYLIIGEGDKREELEILVSKLGLTQKVFFVGAVPQSDIAEYLHISDFFISMYELSNVGNPLLEAIRANKIIFTLNNGDTGKWIKHKENGFIYSENADSLYTLVAKDLKEIIENNDEFNRLKLNIEETSLSRLKTWDERLNLEVTEVEKLIEN